MLKKKGEQTWPVCHVRDNTNLYVELMREILAGGNPGYGKNGYYLAASGSVAVRLSHFTSRLFSRRLTYCLKLQWDDLYAAMAAALARRDVIPDDTVVTANDQNIEAMAQGLGCANHMVAFMLGGR